MLRYYLQCFKVTGYCFLIEHEIKLSVSHKQRQLWTSSLFQPSFYLQMLLMAQLMLTQTMFSGLSLHAVVAQSLKYFWHQFLPTDWQSTLPAATLQCSLWLENHSIFARDSPKQQLLAVLLHINSPITPASNVKVKRSDPAPIIAELEQTIYMVLWCFNYAKS